MSSSSCVPLEGSPSEIPLRYVSSTMSCLVWGLSITSNDLMTKQPKKAEVTSDIPKYVFIAVSFLCNHPVVYEMIGWGGGGRQMMHGLLEPSLLLFSKSCLVSAGYGHDGKQISEFKVQSVSVISSKSISPK